MELLETSSVFMDASLIPFWRSRTMHGESVVLIASEGHLLFAPDAVAGVTSAAGDRVFIEDTDYRVERGARRIVRTAGSRMPAAVAVTYSHSSALPVDTWTAGQGTLPRLAARLTRREAVTVCLTGDSISEGYDVSGFHRVPPYQPAFGQLVAAALEQHYSARVQLHNLAAAGWTAADAVWDAPRIAAPAPDLVIVAFGMNDASYADAGEFAGNVSSLMRRVREDVPGVEFMLVSSMLPTPECHWVVPERFAEYRTALAAMTGEGVDLADVTGLWTAIVGRKNPHDLSGNGSNHPNDFGHRLYAQVILDRLVDWRT
jgi:lysophospholipase L1-like esterase